MQTVFVFFVRVKNGHLYPTWTLLVDCYNLPVTHMTDVRIYHMCEGWIAIKEQTIAINRNWGNLENCFNNLAVKNWSLLLRSLTLEHT